MKNKKGWAAVEPLQTEKKWNGQDGLNGHNGHIGHIGPDGIYKKLRAPGSELPGALS